MTFLRDRFVDRFVEESNRRGNDSMSERIYFGQTAVTNRIEAAIQNSGLIAARNGYKSPSPPPVTCRATTKEAKIALLWLPKHIVYEFDTEDGGIHIPPAEYFVDVTAKSLGAGVYELTFTATPTGTELPPG